MLQRSASHRFVFVAVVTAVPLPVLGYLSGQNWLTLFVVLGLMPLADLLIGGDNGNPSAQDEQRLLRSPWLRWNLYAYVPVHLGLIVWGAATYASGQLTPAQGVGLMLSVGVVTGGQGITIAHELGHRRAAIDRLLARLLLTTVCYGHFFIEHNLGHHARVATRDDPATARLGESFYRFYPRAVVGSLVSAWRLERARLRRRDEAWYGRHNQMLWFAAVPIAVALGLGLAWGLDAALFFLGQSIMAFTLLEAINYVEHYGLVRAVAHNGRIESVGAMHSWNAAERLSNACLINLQRHADHHAEPQRPYALLRHRAESPQLPTGYPGMMLVALLPPVWFRIMDSRVAQLHGSAAVTAPDADAAVPAAQR